MYMVGNSHAESPIPVLREAIECMDAQIWSMQDQLAALQLAKAGMQNILQQRLRNETPADTPYPDTIQSCNNIPVPRSPDVPTLVQ